MTPKQEANKLFTTYHNMIQEYGGDLGQEALVSMLAIKCSLIAVDEIKTLLYRTNRMSQYDYWMEVKNEINKL